MERYHDTLSVISNRIISSPQYIFRPHLIDAAVKCFSANFHGTIAYAVKSNPEIYVLEKLVEAGIKAFDVASLYEVKLIRTLFPKSHLYFMHTVKSRQAISTAYSEFGVRDFSLDSSHELSKILQETNYASDLSLFVRIAVSNMHSKVSLAGKFGIDAKGAIELLKEARKHSVKLGISFHVGSQCVNPEAYDAALTSVGKIIKGASVKVDVINVGGGFPSIYPGMPLNSIKSYFRTIQKSFMKLRAEYPLVEFMCEPGRALVAESGAEIVRVELVKGRCLYINDGTYGGLFDAGAFSLIYPMQAIRLKQHVSEELAPFSLFGPTCDAIDYMPGPFYLPKNIQEGEYLEIGQLGAYSRSLTTSFNGFLHEKEIVEVEDFPLMSLYTKGRLSNKELHGPSFYPKEQNHEFEAAFA